MAGSKVTPGAKAVSKGATVAVHAVELLFDELGAAATVGAAAFNKGVAWIGGD